MHIFCSCAVVQLDIFGVFGNFWMSTRVSTKFCGFKRSLAAQHESVKRARELDEEADAAKKEEKKIF